MAYSNASLCALCGFIIAAVTNFYGVSAQKSQCNSLEFWNSDLDVCVPCASCKKYPKTPSCNTCKSVDETPDVWKLAAITSFSVLAVVLVGAALIIGVMVHRRKSHKRPLREPIEETAGPLYQA
ncbi:tumor necrosis factor receptor superfamily member 12A [Sebastes umbrosus]|uniref:tumor necrosis factor receptor superfamily member 12A n=1 Tax=Sebastes umbrosus TaxID=72105 RepID=UPI00189DA277|nr:tumor necrosis factor receptor superfamily member 12A [Sebastes umbrosus]